MNDQDKLCPNIDKHGNPQNAVDIIMSSLGMLRWVCSLSNGMLAAWKSNYNIVLKVWDCIVVISFMVTIAIPHVN